MYKAGPSPKQKRSLGFEPQAPQTYCCSQVPPPPAPHHQSAERSSDAIRLCPDLFGKFLNVLGQSRPPYLLLFLGHPQLWPWRLWAHYPLGLCPGGSQALWESSGRKEVAQHATTPPLRVPVTTVSPIRTPHFPRPTNQCALL